MVTRDSEVARHRHKSVRPRPTSSRTIGNQETGKKKRTEFFITVM